MSGLPHLKLSIPMSLTLGLSGQPISGADIGGFNFNCTADLLGQWMAIGVYFPFSRNHTISGSLAQEPWAFGPEIEKVSRTAVNRRYRLLPYLYTLLRESSQTGMPLMRPAFFADETGHLHHQRQASRRGAVQTEAAVDVRRLRRVSGRGRPIRAAALGSCARFRRCPRHCRFAVGCIPVLVS